MQENNAPLAELEQFALAAIAADRYPLDHHWFRMLGCSACGTAAQELVVEHHTGSAEGNFRGMVGGHCAQCGREEPLFRFTGPHRRPLRRERIACACGHAAFWVATCERMEGEEGLPGFFDEGVVVARCARCARQQIIVQYD